MNKNKKIIIGVIIALLIIVIEIVIAYKIIEKSVTDREDFKFNIENISSTHVDTVNNEKKETIKWNEITENGVNEELLFQNIDINKLEQISTLLKSLTTEIHEREENDIDFVLSAGWYKYTLDSPQFNEVINMGNDAIKPLYLIIYKSSEQYLYEYICAMALSKLVNWDNENASWSTSKQFLQKFNNKIIEEGY